MFILGVILRDSHGISQVKIVTGNKILRILKAKGQIIYLQYVPHFIIILMLGLAPDLPEDLYHMIKKAVAIRKHLERHRKVWFEMSHVSLVDILNLKMQEGCISRSFHFKSCFNDYISNKMEHISYKNGCVIHGLKQFCIA